LDYESEQLNAYDAADAQRYLMGSIKKPEPNRDDLLANKEALPSGTTPADMGQQFLIDQNLAVSEETRAETGEGIRRTIVGGVRDMAQGAMDLGAELLTEAGEDFLTQSGLTREGAEIQLNIPAPRLPEVAEPKGMIGQIARDFVQFGSGMVVSPGSTIPKAAMSDAFFNPEDGGFITMLRDASLLPEAMNFLAVDVDGESDASDRLKQRLIQAGEGTIIGAVADQVIGTLKRIKDTPELFRKAGETLAKATNATARFADEAGQAADARIAERAADNSVTLAAGADPMPAVDAAISAAGRAARRDPNDSAGDAMAQAQARYFETGKFEPPTAENPVSIVPPKLDEPGIIAFHGSGADFDEFRLEMIGTGEGAQAYGYGLYFTQSEDIAKFYRDGVAFAQTLRGKSKINYKGKPFEDLGDTAAAEAAPPSYNAIMSIASQMQKLTGSFSNLYSDPIRRAKTAKLRVLKQLDADIEKYTKASEVPGAEGIVIGPNGPTLENLLLQDLQRQKQAVLDIDANDIELQTGKMYKVALAPKPDELLDYDKSLRQQPKFAKALKPLYDEYGVAETADIGTLFESIKGARGISARDLTDRLSKAGIPGIKYRAAGSRATTTADEAAERNYVIFDDKAVKILEKYGIVGPVAVTAAGVKSAQDDDDKVANASEM